MAADGFDRRSLDELLDSFIAECDEGLAAAEQALLALERDPRDRESVGAVFRVVHTIKGNAGIFDFAAVTAFAHAMEDLLDGMRRGTTPVTPDVVTLLLRALDALRAILRDSVRGPREISAAEKDLARSLGAGGAENARRRGARQSPPAAGTVADAAPHETRRTLRVDISRLDRLLDLSGEIGISRGRVAQMLADPDVPRPAVLEAHRDSIRLQMEMQELIMKLRMVPVGPAFRQLLRTVRDTAFTLGKEADLRIEGEDVEVDTAVIEQLKDPLVHMVRNGVDHGIETPSARERAGKARAGTLTLRSFHDAGSIVIELEDDGAGLDRDRILSRAMARGLVEAGDDISDEELYEVLFAPGFSTAEQVSDVSGRGVGLDVVRRNIEKIHGSVTIGSRRGAGTKVTIRLPLTLAIIDGLQVGVAGESYIIPMEAVVEALDLGRQDGDATGLIAWRGGDIPYVQLRRRLLTRADAGDSPRARAVVVRHGEKGRAALVVDQLFGECQTVVKPLARLIRGIRGISGSAILPTGKIAFIVDVPGLLQNETARARRRANRTDATGE